MPRTSETFPAQCQNDDRKQPMYAPPATSEIPLPDGQPSLADLLSNTAGVGDIDFEVTQIHEAAQPAGFD